MQRFDSSQQVLCENFLNKDTDRSTLEAVIKCLQRVFQSTEHSPPLCDPCFLSTRDMIPTAEEDPEKGGSGTQDDRPRQDDPHVLIVVSQHISADADTHPH